MPRSAPTSPPRTKTLTLALTSILVTAETQARAELDPLLVADYAAMMRDGVGFPPVEVVQVDKWFVLTDGFHRYAAKGRAGQATICAVVRPGTMSDAILAAAGANQLHGLRRTNDDKRRAVLMVLADATLAKMSDRAIADRIGVHHATVSAIRNETRVGIRQTRTVERGGTTYEMNVAGLRAESGKLTDAACEALRGSPLATNREFRRKLATLPAGRQLPALKLVSGGAVKTLAQAERRLQRDAKAREWAKSAAGVTLAPADFKLHVGDAREELRRVPDHSVALVFTDPPYGIGQAYNGFDDDLTKDELLDLMRGVAAHLTRVLTLTGSAFVMMSSRYAIEVAGVLDAAGLHRQAMIVWGESFGAHNPNFWTDSYRVIFHYTAHPADFTFNADDRRVFIDSARIEQGDGRADPDGKLPGNLWGVFSDTGVARLVGNADERVPAGDDVKVPNQLPQRLVERVVLVASKPGDTVLDPFHGTGTTARACLANKRRYVGIELDAPTADASREWIKAHLARKGGTR